MASFNRLTTILMASAACAVLAGCGADNTAELANPGNTGNNPGVSTSGGSTTTTTSTGGTVANCPAQTTVVTVGTEQHCRLPRTLATDLVLTAGNIYQLNDRLDVGTDTTTAAGAARTLTVAPGTTIYASNTNALINVQAGSKLIADGSVAQPIIFTSAADLGYAAAVGLTARTVYRGPTQGETNATTRGEWGGIVINGLAPTNNPTRVGEGSTGIIHGGTNAADNSGTLRYVQVRYAGFDVGLATGGAVGQNELNGIAFQAVGSGTIVDFVQTHQVYDDCFEFFGGTVNAKHLVCDGNNDDGADWTDGWVGKLQYFLDVQNPNNPLQDNCIEADNLNGANDALPRSNPTLSNVTCVGVAGSTANTFAGGTALFREGTAVKLYNSILSNARTQALDIDGGPTYAQATAGNIVFASIYITADKAFATDAAAGTDPGDAGLPALFAAGSNNASGAASTSTLIAPVTGAARFINGTSETARPAFNISGADSFFSPTTFIGAIQSVSTNWTQGWTEFVNRGA
jgi:hypothetical protein